MVVSTLRCGSRLRPTITVSISASESSCRTTSASDSTMRAEPRPSAWPAIRLIQAGVASTPAHPLLERAAIRRLELKLEGIGVVVAANGGDRVGDADAAYPIGD